MVFKNKTTTQAIGQWFLNLYRPFYQNKQVLVCFGLLVLVKYTRTTDPRLGLLVVIWPGYQVGDNYEYI
jgi:hypothetical protein